MTATMRLNFTVLAAMLVIAIGWGLAMGFRLPTLRDLSTVLALASSMSALALFYTRVRPDPLIARPVMALVAYAIGSTAFRMWVYLTPTTNRPLVDARLAAIDNALGFDWMALLAFYEARPALAAVSTFLYMSSEKVMLITCIVLVLAKRLNRLEQLIAASTIAGLFTLTVSAMFPAAGGFVFYDPPNALFASINPATARDFMDTFHQLRDGTMRHFELTETKGIITFPSFHTIFALLLIWAVRGMRYVFPLALVWNGGIVLTTFIDGGHYLIDVIAGGAVFWATIAVVTGYARRHGEEEPRQSAAARTANRVEADPVVWTRRRA